MKRERKWNRPLLLTAMALVAACNNAATRPEITLVVAGQALIKQDPRLLWEEPFGSLRDLLEGADVAFTNFEMAVMSEADRCGLPPEYEVFLGAPAQSREQRPGNTSGPHAVEAPVMEFLADLGFNLMSLANNHSWDLGDCGVGATREAAHADFVIYYQHFQVDEDEFDEVAPGEATDDGHVWIEDVADWQTDFARAVLDAGASMYLGHGHRAFDGIEIYKGKPLIRQLGGLAYQGLQPRIGHYDQYRPWEGLLASLIIRNGDVLRIELTPLDLNEGESYRADYDDLGFLSRRGLAEIATGEVADSILLRLRELSADYGTELAIVGQRAVIELGGSPPR